MPTYSQKNCGNSELGTQHVLIVVKREYFIICKINKFTIFLQNQLTIVSFESKIWSYLIMQDLGLYVNQ